MTDAELLRRLGSEHALALAEYQETITEAFDRISDRSLTEEVVTEHAAVGARLVRSLRRLCDELDALD